MSVTKPSNDMLTSGVVSDGNADRTLVLGDASAYVRMTRATANTVTVPPNASVAFPLLTRIDGIQAGAGQTTITPGSGVTINGTPGLKTRAQFSGWSLIKVGTDEWDLLGDLSA